MNLFSEKRSLLYLETKKGVNLTMQTDYRLISIVDEEVPLASTIIRENRFFPVTVAVMLTLILVALAITYFIQCRKYRDRIAYLSGRDKNFHIGWNLMKLKVEAQEMELEAAAGTSSRIWNK